MNPMPARTARNRLSPDSGLEPARTLERLGSCVKINSCSVYNFTDNLTRTSSSRLTMLDRFRKRIEGLFSPEESSDTSRPPDTEGAAAPETPTAEKPEVEAAIQAHREARRREARLILSERVHNHAATLMSELRNGLLNEIQQRLQEETVSQSLQDLLQVALDPAFTERLDAAMDGQVSELIQDLQNHFESEPDLSKLLPSKDKLSTDLKAYRDQILRTHMLEQIEVLALPPLSRAFPEGDVPPEQLRNKVTSYWQACREALERFFRSVEMALLNGARPGIRLDPSIIRERLVAAQYRNGYRVLEDRFRSLYGKIAELQMGTATDLDREKPRLDRQVVDEIIVPLAYFIRDRSEPEPKEALRGRTELFREIVDKMVASGDPYIQTAESVKPLLRRSIEQARPLALENFQYLRSSIESLKPAEIHRATALLQLLEVLVNSEVDEKTLQAVEQSVRLNKWQYQLHLQLWRHYSDLLFHLQPLDRIQTDDAKFFTQFIETTNPTAAAVEDMAIRLGYLDLPRHLPDDDQQFLLRVLSVLTLPRGELTSWHFLYSSQPPSEKDLEQLSRAILRQLRPTSVGADDRQTLLGAVPLPIDLSKAVAASGYPEESGDRYTKFREELEDLIVGGKPADLLKAIGMLQKLQVAVEKERISAGLVETEGNPYVSEVWLKESGAMVGLLFFRRRGFGLAPIEKVIREVENGNRDEISQKLRHQLNSQAIIYQSFHKLFGYKKILSRARRQALPTYLKTTYEKIESNRHSLLAHLRNARLLLKRVEEFSQFIEEAERDARGDSATAARILSGLTKKVDQLFAAVDKTKNPAQLTRLAREYERVVRYVNTVVLHAVNPWLKHQTQGLATEFDYVEEEVEEAIRQAAVSYGLDWDTDVERHEAHLIRGTLACRALLLLADGSSKALLLEFDRRRRVWQVKHYGPRITDVVAEEARKHGRSIPDDYDKKFEQPTFSLEEQSCRFLLVKRNVAQIEATLVLDSAELENPWRVVYLKWDDDVLVDRSSTLDAPTA